MFGVAASAAVSLMLWWLVVYSLSWWGIKVLVNKQKSEMVLLLATSKSGTLLLRRDQGDVAAL